MENRENLANIVREVDSHISAAGWDQPVRLFAIVRTADVLAAEPQLANELNLTDELAFTSIEQELATNQDLEELLATIAWPENVIGAILSIERIVLPQTAQNELPDEQDPDWLDGVATHPDRRDVRIISAVLGTGENLNALRYRDHDEIDSVAISENLVPNLNESLLATFAD
jgi:hypothetical protein